MLDVFLFSKANLQNRAAGKEVMQMPRMPKYLKREWAFFLGDCGRKKYNRYAESAKGAASRASVPLLSYAHNTNQKGA